MIIAIVGTFIKIFYLNRDGHGLSRPSLSIIADKYFDYLLPLFFGVTCLLLVWLEFTDNISLILLMLVIFFSYIPAKLFVLGLSYRVLPGRIQRLFAEKGWDISDHITKIESALDYKVYFLSVVGFIIYFLAIYFLNKGISINFSYMQVVIVMSITSLITLLPISFLGIGTRDVGLILVFNWFGRSPEQAVALSMALLLLRLAIVLMGSFFWFIDPPPFTKKDKNISSGE